MIPYRAMLRVFMELTLDRPAHLFDTSSAQLAETDRTHRSIAGRASAVMSGSTIVEDHFCSSVSTAVVNLHTQWQTDPERRAPGPNSGSGAAAGSRSSVGTSQPRQGSLSSTLCPLEGSGPSKAIDDYLGYTGRPTLLSPLLQRSSRPLPYGIPLPVVGP